VEHSQEIFYFTGLHLYKHGRQRLKCAILHIKLDLSTASLHPF